MSRSYRKTPISGIACCSSEKTDKKIWHSRMRAAERTKFKSFVGCYEDYLPVSVLEVVNVWELGKDGKHYFDRERWPKSMRK